MNRHASSRAARQPGHACVLPRSHGAASTLAVALLALLLAGCDPTSGEPPSRAELPPDSILAPVAGKPQARAPVDSLVAHLDGFQFRNGDLSSQHRVQHYCGHVSADAMQCALFDGTGPHAKLVGVEYVISERLFAELPDSEKPYWHSQVQPVKAGTLLAPGLPEEAEHELASRLARTYAKTWRLWPVEERAEVPLGVPQLMMGFTREGQLDQALLAERDRELGVASAEKRRQRQDIPVTPVAPGADAWQDGRIARVQGEVARPNRTP